MQTQPSEQEEEEEENQEPEVQEPDEIKDDNISDLEVRRGPPVHGCLQLLCVFECVRVFGYLFAQKFDDMESDFHTGIQCVHTYAQYVQASIYAHIYTYIHAYIHISIRTYVIHTYMHACMHT